LTWFSAPSNTTKMLSIKMSHHIAPSSSHEKIFVIVNQQIPESVIDKIVGLTNLASRHNDCAPERAIFLVLYLTGFLIPRISRKLKNHHHALRYHYCCDFLYRIGYVSRHRPPTVGMDPMAVALLPNKTSLNKQWTSKTSCWVTIRMEWLDKPLRRVVGCVLDVKHNVDLMQLLTRNAMRSKVHLGRLLKRKFRKLPATFTSCRYRGKGQCVTTNSWYGSLQQSITSSLIADTLTWSNKIYRTQGHHTL